MISAKRAVAAMIGLVGLVAGAAAADSRLVPDLLELPARSTSRALHSLQLAVSVAGERLVSVGERGMVLLSDDQGRSWRQARSVPVSVTLTDVCFISATQGWAVGHSGVVLHSEDAGDNWTLQLDGAQAARAVLAEAQRRAEAGEAGAEAAVRSAGYLVGDGPDKPFLSVHFTDAERGWIVGAYGLALETVDGGRNWRSIVGRIPNPRGNHLYQIREDGERLMIAGEQGALFRSADAGASFEAVGTPYGGTYFGTVAAGSGAVLAFGLRGNAWRSEDGITQWRQLDLGQPVTVAAGLRMNDGSVVLADESGRLLRSPDGGGRHPFRPLPAPSVPGLSGLAQTRDGALILAGARGLVRIEPKDLYTVEVAR